MGIQDLFTNRRQDNPRPDDTRRPMTSTPSMPVRRDLKRQENDQPKLPYGVRYKTSGSVKLIEDWLEENCQGDWQLGFDNMCEDLGCKIVLIMFEREPDKSRFLGEYRKQKA